MFSHGHFSSLSRDRSDSMNSSFSKRSLNRFRDDRTEASMDESVDDGVDRDNELVKTMDVLMEYLKAAEEAVFAEVGQGEVREYRIATIALPSMDEDTDNVELEDRAAALKAEQKNNKDMLESCRAFFVFTAANTLQRVWRGHVCRVLFVKKEKIRLLNRRHGAAKRIQTLYRGYCHRGVANKAKAKENELYPWSAAIQMQRIARGFIVRQRLKRRKKKMQKAIDKFDQTKGTVNRIGFEEDDNSTDSDDEDDYDDE